jgi:hypothetical protein
MSTKQLSRRALVRGAAAIPAAAVLPAAASEKAKWSAPAVNDVSEPDPIFAAIEAHREAFIRDMRAAKAYSDLESDVADAHAQHAYGLLRAAEGELANTEPTTMAGILALLAYVDDFHCQAIVHPDEPKHWHSGEENLGKLIDEDIIDKFSGEPIELPFMFWVMRNVREALQGMGIAA